MSFIITLNWSKLIDFIDSAQKSIYLVAPGIDDVLAGHLCFMYYHSDIEVRVCIDNSENAIRNGYGEAYGIDILVKNNMPVRQCKNNRISLIIVDDKGYYIFPESRIFTADPEGPNAIEISPLDIIRLLQHFFPPEDLLEKEQIEKNLDGAIRQQLTEMKETVPKIRDGTNGISRDFDTGKFNEIKKSLKANPPLEPDIQRKMKVYNAKIQFVELKFTGINIQSKKVSLPQNTLPLKNEELKKLILTNIRLFQKPGNSRNFAEIDLLKNKIENLRRKYLIPITCREGKSILKMENKEEFKSKISGVEHQLKELEKSLSGILEGEILHTKNILKSELLNFFQVKENEPDFLKFLSDEEKRQLRLTEYIDWVVRKIHFPQPLKLIENINLTSHYYDLTWTDFGDKVFLNELKAKGVLPNEDIRDIVELKDAYAVKK